MRRYGKWSYRGWITVKGDKIDVSRAPEKEFGTEAEAHQAAEKSARIAVDYALKKHGQTRTK